MNWLQIFAGVIMFIVFIGVVYHITGPVE